jgi:hypothetical protein
MYDISARKPSPARLVVTDGNMTGCSGLEWLLEENLTINFITCYSCNTEESKKNEKQSRISG